MMNLHIIRPLSKEELQIAWVEIETPVGNFVIQPKHAPMVLTLTPGEDITFCLSNGKQKSIPVKQGIVEITRNGATILLSE